MKKRNRLVAISIFITICTCAFISLRYFVAIVMTTPMQMTPLDDPPPPGKGYIIDPNTILVGIDTGKADIFKIADEGMPKSQYTSGSFAWSSTDYLEIAKANHLYLTGELAIGEWKLFPHGDFDIYQCRDNMQGFDSATIIFYKRSSNSFLSTYINVFPLRNFVNSDYLEYDRVTYDDNWLAKLLFNPDASYKEALPIEGSMNAEHALQIAEEAGGAELRQQLSNNCDIHITYSTDDWVVWYSQSGTKLLTVDIDAKDGTYKIK